MFKVVKSSKAQSFVFVSWLQVVMFLLKISSRIVHQSRIKPNQEPVFRLAERLTVCLCANLYDQAFYCFGGIISDAHFCLRQRRLIGGDLIHLKTCQGLTEHLFSCVSVRLPGVLPDLGQG